MNQEIKRHLPTRKPGALRGSFDGWFNIHSNPDATEVFGAKIESSPSGEAYWLSRIGPFKEVHHHVAELIEIGREPQMRSWIGETPGDKGWLFWPAVSNEFMARCFCGSAQGARKLFEALEERFGKNDALIQELLGDEHGEGLQAMLVEFEPEGLGLVHFVFNYDWDGPWEQLEAELRSDAHSGFDQLPWTYCSQDYFNTYDTYGTDSFLSQTCPEMAEAAWRHCHDKKGLKYFLKESPNAMALYAALTQRQELSDTVPERSKRAQRAKGL